MASRQRWARAVEEEWAAQEKEREQAAHKEKHEARLAKWSRYTTLDPDIAEKRDLERQVLAQNRKIEKRVDALSRILTRGLTRLALPNAPDVSDVADHKIEPKTIARVAEYHLQRSSLDDDLDFKPEVRVAYTPESRQLVIESELPDVSVVPKAKHYRYIKSRDEISETARPQSQVKSIYANTIAQLTLLSIATVFATDEHGGIDVVVYNGLVDTIDPRSGQ
jgi:hypothetical protein